MISTSYPYMRVEIFLLLDFQAKTNCVLSHRILTPELEGFKAKVRKKMSLGLDNNDFTILNEEILS